MGEYGECIIVFNPDEMRKIIKYKLKNISIDENKDAIMIFMEYKINLYGKKSG